LNLPAQCAEPIDTAIVTDDAERVGSALRSLPDEQRRSLLLAAFYGLSAREISEVESIPLGTAKSRIRLSLKKVRLLLNEDMRSDGTETEGRGPQVRKQALRLRPVQARRSVRASP
jgi:DNA-directed RNA polymerase specialized sigma24 family protein